MLDGGKVLAHRQADIVGRHVVLQIDPPRLRQRQGRRSRRSPRTLVSVRGVRFWVPPLSPRVTQHLIVRIRHPAAAPTTSTPATGGRGGSCRPLRPTAACPWHGNRDAGSASSRLSARPGRPGCPLLKVTASTAREPTTAPIMPVDTATPAPRPSRTKRDQYPQRRGTQRAAPRCQLGQQWRVHRRNRCWWRRRARARPG